MELKARAEPRTQVRQARGVFTVKLTVTDDGDLADTAEETIRGRQPLRLKSRS